jgi:hypothetical protein
VQILGFEAGAKLSQQLVGGTKGEDAPAIDGEGSRGGLPAIQGVDACVGE